MIELSRLESSRYLSNNITMYSVLLFLELDNVLNGKYCLIDVVFTQEHDGLETNESAGTSYLSPRCTSGRVCLDS